MSICESYSSSEYESNEKIYIHTAKITTDDHGYIYNPKILKYITVDHIVRISFEVVFNQIEYWNHDAPYVKIVMQSTDGLLGEVQNINRIPNTNNYPLAIGERIWFKLNNIIEIPGEYNNDKFVKYLTKKYVMTTGPLYTIESDDSSSDSDLKPLMRGDDSDSAQESYSDSE